MFNLQAWFETEYGNNNVDITCGSRTAESISYSYIGTSSADATGENRKESTYLYIQMEYCPRYIFHKHPCYFRLLLSNVHGSFFIFCYGFLCVLDED